MKLKSFLIEDTIFLLYIANSVVADDKSMVSCQKGPTCHAYTWQIGPFWQDTLKIMQGARAITAMLLLSQYIPVSSVALSWKRVLIYDSKCHLSSGQFWDNSMLHTPQTYLVQDQRFIHNSPVSILSVFLHGQLYISHWIYSIAKHHFSHSSITVARSHNVPDFIYFSNCEPLERLTTISLSDIAIHMAHEYEWAICSSDFMQ